MMSKSMASNYLFNMFSQSPILPLQEHMIKVHSCTETLLSFIEAALKNDWPAVETYQQQIAELEREADNIKRDLRFHLPKRIFMPVSRTDVLELLTVQDTIANKARDIAGLVLGRKMQFPEAISEQVLQLFKRSVDASAQAKKIIIELEDVFEAGFRGNELKVIQEMIQELDNIEHDTDKIQIEIRRTLFSIEKTLPPVDAIFLYKVIEWGGDLADRAHHVGGRLLMLLAS
jgi:uncharacterized protein